MKPTAHFFIHQKRQAILYCETLSFKGDILTANVINGAWMFSVNVKTGFMAYDSPSGHHVQEDCRVMWLRDSRFGHDYNRAIEWANGRLQMNPVGRWFGDITDATRFKVRSFWKRLSKACKAFSDSWSGKKLPAIYEDQIPF